MELYEYWLGKKATILGRDSTIIRMPVSLRKKIEDATHLFTKNQEVFDQWKQEERKRNLSSEI